MPKGKFAIGEYELVVKRSRAGRGLFTLGPIERGRCVVEYTGRVLSEAEMYTNNSKYLFGISEKKTIDGRGKTNAPPSFYRAKGEKPATCARALNHEFILANREFPFRHDDLLVEKSVACKLN